MGKYDALLYKRGFLFTDLPNPRFVDSCSQQAFGRFRAIPFAQWTAYCDDCVPTAIARADADAVLLIGLVLNPFDEQNDAERIAQNLLRCRQSSEACFLDYLSELSGRFVLALYYGGTLEFFADACATRTVYYDRAIGRVIFSSHATMIADLMGYERSDEACYFFYNPLYKKAPLKRLPGVISPFDSVRLLTPNTKVDARTKQVTRIFPSEENPVCTDYAALEEEVAALMVRQITLLHQKEQIMMSLSAGLDSRFTLSACKAVADDMTFFTHLTKNSTHCEDFKTATEICRHFALRHTVYRWSNEKYKKDLYEFEQVWQRNLGLPRGLLWLNKIYADDWPHGKIHLRSNIAEVAKADLSDHERCGFSPETLAYLYTMTPMQHDARVIEKMSEFIDLTGFTPENLYHYDFYDLFEWELIMAQWHSWLLLESDLAHDTFLLFNNRKILSKMLSLPYEDRLHKKLFFGVIRRLWPDLLQFPINGQLFAAECSGD